jgi:hypothetical protein
MLTALDRLGEGSELKINLCTSCREPQRGDSTSQSLGQVVGDDDSSRTIRPLGGAA